MRKRGRGERHYRPQSLNQSEPDAEKVGSPVDREPRQDGPAAKRRRRSRFSSLDTVEAKASVKDVGSRDGGGSGLHRYPSVDEEFAKKEILEMRQRGGFRNRLQVEDDIRDTNVFGVADDEDEIESSTPMAKPKMVRGDAQSVFMQDANGSASPGKAADTSAHADENAKVDPLESFMLNVEQKAKIDIGLAGKGAAAGKEVLSDDDGDTETDEKEEEKVDDSQGFLVKARKKRLVYEKVDHSTINYPPFKKDLYIEVPELSRMSFDDVVAIRRTTGGIRIRGKRCPKPVLTFSQCGLPSAILGIIKSMGFVAPTPIQAQAIPAVMSGRDCIGIAKTGSGKTLAYLLPALRHAAIQSKVLPGEGPIAIIIAPTRELAMQIYGESKRFGRPIGLRSVCVYGGSSIASQISDLKRGVEIAVCTPGRMIDLLAMNHGRVTNLRRCTFVVLDEADRMFDLGFAPQLARLVENVRPDKQVALFSATFPPAVEALARKVLKQPIEITAGGNSTPASSIKQHVEVRSEGSKFLRLLSLLGEYYSKGSTLIFVDRQENADKIYSSLQKAGYKCLPLHGGVDQADRDSALADFKASLVKVLVATSVAARGLDVKDLNLVVNYDVPNHYEDYVHRIGRTGRAGRSGTAYTFITPEQGMFAAKLVKALEIGNQLSSKKGLQTSKDDSASLVEVPDELRKLADEFENKRRRGEVKHVASGGYGGKGFKFTADEDTKSTNLRKLQAKQYAGDADDTAIGFDGSDIEAGQGDEDEDDIVVREISRESKTTHHHGPVSKTDESITSATVAMTDEEIKALMQEEVTKEVAIAKNDGIDEAEKANRIVAAKARVLSMAAARSKAAAQHTTRQMTPAASSRSVPSVKPAPVGGVAASVAAKAAALISAKLGVEGNALAVDGNGGRNTDAHEDIDDKKKFATELEINDYPQHARWRVTHKNSLADVEEFTECAFTTKGNHYPPGRNPPPGERKLFLLIEGPDVASVKNAWREVKRKLEEAAAARPEDRGTYSKYSVL
eukprot:Plantae.Rhodophyta-Hildenbrandia_rubra.ctg857.p2 GENE.Plantae.Rhodophyta-Hildenbrandia_rubra.ctg857~~Plantae.Rhodophyta-Hildenbrandia_rubra.ctg857.p2  ORF type:complete len:1017 (-),score=224.10 Plantae.Rhodophyta-Hildenbrandia_rubra.ctg857:10622-13672(-)